MTEQRTFLNATSDKGLVLPGLEGANPLGFLASLGTLAIVSTGTPSSSIKLSWWGTAEGWIPRIHGAGLDPRLLAKQVANRLALPFTPAPDADQVRDAAQRRLDAKRTDLKNAVSALKKRKLKGKKLSEAQGTEIDPIRKEVQSLRGIWLDALRKTVPSLEISLGKHLNASGVELRDSMRIAIEESRWDSRENADLYAAFGSDACLTKDGKMLATPFCFTTGSGHQYFLDTVRQLFGCVDESRVFSALSTRTDPNDEKLSLRWDPAEDRRYALMWSDPTASNNKPKTNWALNLLAYKGLQFFPSVPITSGELGTTGWSDCVGIQALSWPLWEGHLAVDAIRSLVAHRELVSARPRLSDLRAIGVCAVFRSERIQVGKPPLHKINFGPSRQVE
jgi:hypothetical protein